MRRRFTVLRRVRNCQRYYYYYAIKDVGAASGLLHNLRKSASLDKLVVWKLIKIASEHYGSCRMTTRYVVDTSFNIVQQ